MKTQKFRYLALLALGGCVMLAPLAHAQQEGKTEGRKRGGPGGSQQIIEQLGLTDEQKPKVTAILEEQQKKMGELFQNQDMSREDRMAKLGEMRQATTAKLKEVLTDEQMKKYEARPQGFGGRGGPGGFGGGGNRMEEMAKQLELTDEQKTKIQAIYDEMQKKIQDLPREDRFAKFGELRDATNAKIKAVLTPEQQEKFAKMGENRGPGRGGDGQPPKRREKKDN